MITFNEIKYFNSLPDILFKEKINDTIQTFSENSFNDFLNNNGFCIVNNVQNAIEFFQKKSDIFGDIIHQTNDKKSLGYSVSYSQNNKPTNYQLNSNRAQPLHTDGHYAPITPKFIALYCVNQSYKGGISQIIKSQDIYSYLQNKCTLDTKSLFDTKINYKRKSPTGGYFDYSRSLFNLNDDKLEINYNPIMYSISSTIRIENTLRLINYYCANPNNQIQFRLKSNQLLVMNNLSVLHGRSSFPIDSERKMERFWLTGI